MNRISNRSVELVEDPDYGDASPIEAAEIILPATRAHISITTDFSLYLLQN